MNSNDIVWILVVLLIAIPVLVVAVMRLIYRKRGGIGSGIGGTIFVTLCWVVAIVVILRRTGAF